MSYELPRCRETPLWSTGGQDPSAEALMAGLPGSRALVAVGPPLAAKLPNLDLGSMGCGSVPMVSPSLGMNPQSLSMPIRLWVHTQRTYDSQTIRPFLRGVASQNSFGHRNAIVMHH